MSEAGRSIHIEQNGSVAILRMDRGKVNAIDIELLQDFERRLTEVENSEAAAVVLTGTGKAFSAGVDLFRLLQEEQSYVEDFLPFLVLLFERLFAFPKPMVAAVNGHAIAGGCILTCVCDYRIMAAGTGRIGITELLVGVPFPPIALEIMRFSTPPQHFQNLLYTGRTCNPDEALRMGLIDEVVEASSLLDRAVERAAAFADIPFASFLAVKRQVRKPAHEIASDRSTDKEIMELWKSKRVHDAIRGYLEKTIGKNRE